MKHLRIDAGKGQFSIDGASWIEIDKIGRDDIMALLSAAVVDGFEMDTYEKGSLANPAHDIIYRNLAAKFQELASNRERFADESQRVYASAIRKYISE
jgi:hypothetical protein